MENCNSCEPKKEQLISNASCGCGLDFTTIPTLNDGIYPDCLPPKDYVYIYRRANNILYYYDHYGVETELRGRPYIEDLTLQIEGVTEGVYDGLEPVTFDVTREKLQVYSKDELDKIIENLYKYIDGKTIIEDNLTSDAADHALSARMGKELKKQVDSKQDTLVSGVNIQTINGHNILQAGNYNTPTTTVEDNLTSTSTINALSANQGRRLKEMIDAIEPSAFVKYRFQDIISVAKYQVHPELNMMYKANIAADITLVEANKVETYATTYMLLTNISVVPVTMTFPKDASYLHFPRNINTITIQPGNTVEIAVKGYGSYRIVTFIDNVAEKDYYTKDEIDDMLLIINESIKDLGVQRRFGVVMELDQMLVPVGEPMTMYYFTAKNVAKLQIKANNSTDTWKDVPLNQTVAFNFDGNDDVLFHVDRATTDIVATVWVKSINNL